MELRAFILGIDTGRGPNLLIVARNKNGAFEQARQLCQERGIQPSSLVFIREVHKGEPIILGE